MTIKQNCCGNCESLIVLDIKKKFFFLIFATRQKCFKMEGTYTDTWQKFSKWGRVHGFQSLSLLFSKRLC